MLTIVPVTTDADSISAVESGDYAVLTYADSTLSMAILPRPGNHSEAVYLNEGVLSFVPGSPPTLAAHLGIQGNAATLTLYPLPVAVPPAPTL